VPPFLAPWIGTVVEALARGFAVALLDELERRQRGIEEVPDEADRARARRLHDAVSRILQGGADHP